METIDVLFIGVVLGDGARDRLTKAAVVGGSCVGEDGNLHTNVSRSDGSEGSNEERDGSVWEVGWEIVNISIWLTKGGLVDLSSIDGETDDEGKHAAEE